MQRLSYAAAPGSPAAMMRGAAGAIDDVSISRANILKMRKTLPKYDIDLQQFY
jgi:hypothetical protein